MAARPSQQPPAAAVGGVEDGSNDTSGEAPAADPKNNSSNNSQNSTLMQQLQVPADFVGDALEHLLSKSTTYDFFLRSQLTDSDLYFVRDESVAKQLVELGCRGYGEQFSKAEYDRKRAKLAKQKREQEAGLVGDIFNGLASEGADIADSAILSALAERELENRENRISTVIFMRLRMANNHEISVYIDYADRLSTSHAEWKQIFHNRKPIRPRFRRDLSYYNWSTRVIRFNNTANFTILSTINTVSSERPVSLRSKLSGQFVRLGPGISQHSDGRGTVNSRKNKKCSSDMEEDGDDKEHQKRRDANNNPIPTTREQMQADVERHVIEPAAGTPEADYYIQFIIYDIIYHSHFYEADLATRRSVRALQASAFNQKRKQQLADQGQSTTSVPIADGHGTSTSVGGVDTSRAYTLNDFIKILDQVDT